MTASEQTLLLENLLANKNYLPLKLKAPELKVFGLKSKPVPTVTELQKAIEPHLGGNLMLAYRENVLCLAKKMSAEELAWAFYPERFAALKGIFAQCQPTEKRYVTWEQLWEELGESGRKLFKVSTAKKAKNNPDWQKLQPFLAPPLDIHELSGEGYLAFNMTKEEVLAAVQAAIKAKQAEIEAKAVAERAALSKLLESRLTNYNHNTKEKKSYVLLKLSTAELGKFGLKSSAKAPTASALEKAIIPFLGSNLKLFKKKPAGSKKEELYLAYTKPFAEFITESLQSQHHHKPLMVQTLADDVPLSNTQFLETFNQMLAAGQIQVTKIDDKFGITGIQLAVSLLQSPKIEVSGKDYGKIYKEDYGAFHKDCETFRKAFDKLVQGRITGLVRICNMRRELGKFGWSEDQFDAMLCKLRLDCIIHLHAGDAATMTAEDVKESFTDANNSFYATLTWKK